MNANLNIYDKSSSLFNSNSHLVLSFFLKTIPKEVIHNFVIWNILLHLLFIWIEWQCQLVVKA